MRAEPQDFQYVTPTGFADPTADAEAEVDPSQVNLFAGDHIDGASSNSSTSSGSSVRDFIRFGDIGLIGRLSDIVAELRLSAAVRSSLIGVALIVAFGLGWTGALFFNSNADDASLAPPDQRTELSGTKLDAAKRPVRRHHRIASPAAAPKAALAELNKPKPAVAVASARPSSSAVAQIGGEPQNIPSGITQERTAWSGSASAASDQDQPLVPVPETKPTTIPGWTVREVYGENAVLVGPDHVWTVKAGDNLPGVGRIDSIVRWGNRWIVATTAGLISTE